MGKAATPDLFTWQRVPTGWPQKGQISPRSRFRIPIISFPPVSIVKASCKAGLDARSQEVDPKMSQEVDKSCSFSGICVFPSDAEPYLAQVTNRAQEKKQHVIPKTTSKGTLHLSPSSLDSTPYGEVGLPAEMTLGWPNEEEPRLPPCQPWEGATWIAEALI